MHLVFADIETNAPRQGPPFWALLAAVMLVFGGLGALIATVF